MNDAFSIDPSIRACGWARYINPTKYIYAGLCQSKEKKTEDAILDIYEQIEGELPIHIRHLIIEKPILVEKWTKEKKKNIEKLLTCYGALLTLKKDKSIKLWTPSVPEWKGQLSKETSHYRAYELIGKNHIQINIMKGIPNSLFHNTKDAIALLVTYLKKEGIIHV